MQIDFDEAWRRADRVPGWLKREQARLLWDGPWPCRPALGRLRSGATRAARQSSWARLCEPGAGCVVAVDPFVEGRLFGGSPTRDAFERTIAGNDLGDVVELVAAYSRSCARGGPSRSTCSTSTASTTTGRCPTTSGGPTTCPRGRVVIHDCFSSIGVTLGVLRHVLVGEELAYERRSDSQALFRKRRPTTADRLRIVAQLPWWIRNVGLKVLLRLRLRPVARALGHDSPYDPY